MEVEVKIKLPSQEARDQLAATLASGHRARYEQENYFFDGTERELSAQRAVLRVRFYNVDEKAVITLKGRQVLTDGVGRATEVEEGVDPAVARGFLQDPQRLLELPGSQLMQGARSAYNIGALQGLGGFRNTRNVFAWSGLELELDTTHYPWGTTWELECETERPEEAKAQLEELLTAEGVPYRYSTTTKFANFINKKLD